MKPTITKTPLEQLEEYFRKEVKRADDQVTQYKRYVNDHQEEGRHLRTLCQAAGIEAPWPLKEDTDLSLMEELRTAQKDVADLKGVLEQVRTDRDLHRESAVKNGRDVNERDRLIEELRKEKQQLRLELEELRSASPRDTLKRIALRWLKP